MRVVGGIYRHRILIWPEDSDHIRPTKDRIREAIFSSLGDLSGMKVLDLYSGSGAMGIEALSRNASFCTFVDINDVAIKTTKTNVENLKISNAKIIKKDDESAIISFIYNKEEFDLVIIDPPYKEGKYEKIIDTFINNKLISNKGVFVIESQSKLDYSKFNFKKVKQFHYGEINVDILYC